MVEHNTDCRCSICMMQFIQLQLGKVIGIGSLTKKAKNNRQQMVVLPTPRASGREGYNGNDSAGSNDESASDLTGGSSSGINNSDSNSDNKVDSDMLWSLFDQPRRKRGLRPSQLRVRNHALMGSQRRIRGRGQMESQARS